jgi:hypothetical protein
MATSTTQSPTGRNGGPKKIAWCAALVVAAAARADATTRWPPFLPPDAGFPPGVVASVERIWRDPSLSRSVEGPVARVPFGAYAAFVDFPDVTAAAARHLGVARYEVRVLDDDWYQADDHAGARGVYRVLVRDGTRRVILSWGSHTGAVLGTLSGSALTVLDFEDRGTVTGQRLQAYVLIENRFAAALARLLIVAFGHVADRKLGEGFRVSARVAEWATEQPEAFCAWLAREPLVGARRERVLKAIAACQAARSP